MLEITAQIGPFKTFTAVVNGKVVATVRKVRGQWLLTDKVGCSFNSSFPLVKSLTSCKAFDTKTQAVSFIKKHYS